MALMGWMQRREALGKAERILTECCAELGLPPKSLGRSGREWLSRRRFTGADEMRRAIYAAALCARDGRVEAVHFPPCSVRDHEALAKRGFEDLALEDAVRHKVEHFFVKLGDASVEGLHRAVMDQAERPLIAGCLRWAGGNQAKAARALGINRNTLRKRIRELRIGEG
jgi:two-component system nitrogen regulation response regulator GlnG